MKGFFAFAAALFATSSGYCAPAFNYESAVSSASLAPEHIEPYDGGSAWRLYYSSGTYPYGGWQIYSATSTDMANWGMESGVRISTSGIGGANVLGGFGMYYDPSPSLGNYHYRGFLAAANTTLPTTGYYLLSARSTDQINWEMVSTAAVSAAYMNSPRPLLRSDGSLLLLYITDSGGAGNPSDYRIYYSTSGDHGVSFGAAAQLKDDNAFAVYISTLTGGRVRLYYSAPYTSTGTAPCAISSYISSSGGFYFSKETGVLLSTTTSTSQFADFAVARSSEVYSWRLLAGVKTGATNYIASALSDAPYAVSVSPNVVYYTDSSRDLTLSGEVFSQTISTITVSNGSYSIYVASVTRNSDISAAFTVQPASAPLGSYTVTIINDNGKQSALANALIVDYPPGTETITDNLFRPLRGETCKFDVAVYNPGRLTLRAYTINGQPVKKIYDADIASGVQPAIIWNGDTDAGNKAASGLYFVTVKGPKLDKLEKVVIVK
ncbi:MAG: hypothetical protein WC421_06325 [Elusimicrobiales bacterium]